MLKKSLLLVVASVLLLGIVSCGSDTGKSPQTPETVAETYLQAASEGDIDTCLGLLSDDFIFRQEPPGITIEGKTKYQAALKQRAAWNYEITSVSPLEVDVGKVTCSIVESGDDFRIIGMSRIEGTIEMLIRDGKIYSIISKPKADDWTQFVELTSGGVGIEIRFTNKGTEVTGFTPGSLAAASGLQVGDTIVAVDRINYTEMREGEFQLRCMGAFGTKVLLTVIREGGSNPVDIEVTRVRMNLINYGTEPGNTSSTENAPSLSTEAENIAQARSVHFSSGYYVELMVTDPHHTIRSIEVTGPGINGSLLLHQLRPSQWGSQSNINLGSNPPNLPLVYTFIITDNEEDNHMVQDEVLSYVEGFATVISPSGNMEVTNELVFTWRAVNIPEVHYQVQLNDDKGRRIWDSSITTATSFVYDGPILPKGNYEYYVSACSKSGDESLALGSFNVVSMAEEKTLLETLKPEILRIEPEPQKGFYWAYYLYVPNSLVSAKENKKTYLLVEPNNTGYTSDNQEVHDTSARIIAEEKTSFLAKDLGVPLLVPTFPRPKEDWNIYTHALDRDTLLTKKEELERLDLQLISMIDDAKERLSQKGIILEDKILMTGFSASGMFVNRFIVLHPEKVKAAAIGSPGGWPIVPVGEWNGAQLRYPIGISDLEQLVGKGFNAGSFQSVKLYFYLGDLDTNDSVPYQDGYTQRDKNLIFQTFGDTPVKRWPIAEEIYKFIGASSRFVLYSGVGHNTTVKIVEDVKTFFLNNLEAQ
jgi:hypothetical protein